MRGYNNEVCRTLEDRNAELNRSVSVYYLERRHRIVAEDSRYGYFIRQALLIGEKAIKLNKTPVGYILVYNNQIVESGMNNTNRSMNRTKHTEFITIGQMLQTHPRSVLQLTDLYVTAEPCVMCVSALRQYRIRSVIFGCANDRFGGTGGVLNLHSDSSIDPKYPVYSRLFKKKAIMLLRRFYVQEKEKTPDPVQPIKIAGEDK